MVTTNPQPVHDRVPVLGRTLNKATTFSTLVVLLVVFVVVLIVNVLGSDGLAALDPGELGWTIAHRNGTLTPIAIALSDVGGTVPMTALAVLVFLGLMWRRQWPQAGLVGVATLGAGALVVGVKQLVDRQRPPAVEHLVVETNQAFPSGHSLGSIVVIGVVTAVSAAHLRHRALRVTAVAVAAIFVAAVGLSRLYLGVHWPTDILGGWSMGALWVTICLAVYQYLDRTSGFGFGRAALPVAPDETASDVATALDATSH